MCCSFTPQAHSVVEVRLSFCTYGLSRPPQSHQQVQTWIGWVKCLAQGHNDSTVCARAGICIWERLTPCPLLTVSSFSL